MWSVGCIFAEMLMGKALFPGKDEPDQMDKITRLCGSITDKTTPGCEKWPQCAPAVAIAGDPVLLLGACLLHARKCRRWCVVLIMPCSCPAFAAPSLRAD